MDINQLEVLVTVAQEQSFSRAAERLHRTQPAVSQAVKRLEEELGEPLFDRSSKDGTLTAAGRVLVVYAQQMLNLRSTAQSSIRELRDLQRGKVCLSANEYTVMSLLPIINAYREMHPHIKIEVKRSLASRIPGEVLGRDVEIGVVSFKPTDTELGLESFIAHNVPSPYRERVVRTFEKFKTPLNISMEMPTLEAIKRFVEQRAGVALMPRLAAQNEIATGRLSALSVREMLLERRLFLIYRNSAGLSHAARAFLKIAKKQHQLEVTTLPST